MHLEPVEAGDRPLKNPPKESIVSIETHDTALSLALIREYPLEGKSSSRQHEAVIGFVSQDLLTPGHGVGRSVG
jgi:hypothetical protein